MRFRCTLVALICSCAALVAQQVRPKDVRETAKAGAGAIPKLQEYLKDPSRDVRVEAVKQLTELGTQKSLDPLIEATRDTDPEVQTRAAAGLVNFYSPGYVDSGLGDSIKRVGGGIKGLFSEGEDLVIDPYVTVRPEVITALGRLATAGASMASRAGGARAIGVLRGGAAVSDLIEAAHSRDSGVIYESLVALRKVGDLSAGPRVEFRLRDLDPKVQEAAIVAVGMLRDKGALPALADVFHRATDARIRRAAMTSIAMLPDESSRPLYVQCLKDKDERLRAAAAEGFGRLHEPKDLPMLEQAWQDEGKTSPRLSLAFAVTLLGKTELSEFSPFQFLIDNLNSASYQGVAFPFLVELGRDAAVRQALYGAIPKGTKSEKIGLAQVLARDGDQQSVPELQKLSKDGDADVAGEALRALRSLQARL
jgi:HEAT repeat protein